MHCDNCPFKQYPSCGSRGNTFAKIAIVGRNPGKNEAISGRPFTGASGKVLNGILDRIGLSENDVYILNAVNCHFPGDENPNKEAYEACSSRLYDELSSIDPKIIITLGNEATASLVQTKEKISNLVGTMQYNEKLGKWIIPSYHPAYILRGNTFAFNDLEMALDRSRRIAQGLTPLPEPLPYDKVHYIDSIGLGETILNNLIKESDNLLSLDTETDFARDPNWNLLLVQISDGKDAWVFEGSVLKSETLINSFRHLLRLNSKTWIFHNCFTGETLLDTPGGHKRIDSIKTGDKVYSVNPDTFSVTLGTVTDQQMTGVKEVIRILLDNEKIIECTPNHKFLVKRNRRWRKREWVEVEAKDLTPEDSLVPLYRKRYNGYGYTILECGTGMQVNEHVLVAEAILGTRPVGHHVHHLNQNKHDNRPENLVYTHYKDHPKYHINGLKGKKMRLSSREKMRQRKLDDPRYQVGGELVTRAAHIYSPLRGKRKSNHRIVSIEKITEQKEVYGITVEPYHNYALASGVFVKNSAFDLQQLKHHFNTTPKNIEDTMALALCLDEKLSSAGLKKLVNNYLSVPHYETELSKYRKHDKVPFSAVPRKVLVPYAGFDAIYTHRLFPILKDLVEKEGNYHLYTGTLRPSQEIFAQLSYNGIQVDLDYVETLRKEYYPVRDRIEKDLQNFAKSLGYKASEVVKAPKSETLNVGSPKQLIYFFNKYLHLRTNTSDNSFIEQHKDQYPFISLLKQHRTLAHLLNTYVDGIADETWPDGRVHPDFIHGAVTGRLAIQHPALQTLPNEWVGGEEFGSIRKLFIVPKGFDYLSADYKQLEIRVAAFITGDKNLQKAVDSLDIHRETASKMFGKSLEEITDQERTFAKKITFGVMYGQQEFALSQTLGVDLDTAKQYIRSFFEAYPKYARWWLETRESVLECGELSTLFGRKRRWSIITPDTENHIKNEAVNFPIQSIASDMTLRSMIRLQQVLAALDFGRVLFTVHDSLEFEIRHECLKESVKVIKDTMEKPLEKFGTVFPVDIEYGRSMGELKKWTT